ncbi:MAG TPA: ABC transporter permease [Candidatus Limnocylindria bacterium]
MRLENILAIFRKDAVDALRDARIAVSLLVPIGLGLLYNSIFPEERLLTVKLAYHADDTSAILAGIREQTGSTVDLRVREVADEAAARAALADRSADVALIVPRGSDAAIRQGQAPSLLLIGQDPPGTGETFVARALDQTVRTMAGQRPAAQVRVERVHSGIAETAGLEELGTRRFFVLATVVMLIAMVGLLAVPVILTEEMEKKTIDALLLVAKQSEVITAKSLVGLLYVALGVPLMMALTRLEIRQPVTFVAGALLLSVVLVGIGLLLAGVFRTATRVYTWSSLFVLVAFVPSLVVGLPVPTWADVAAQAIPTGQGMRLMLNGIAEHELFPNSWIAYAVLVVWAVATFGLLRWQLGRREA